MIIDALIDLLGDKPSDEIAIRDIARRAGVAERTVYRHFPDRRGLHEAVTERFREEDGPTMGDADDLDDLADLIGDVYATFEASPRETAAAVLLNADPRRLAEETAERSTQWVERTARSLPELDERQCLGVAAITRTLGSSQMWLRLREEFGMEGDESAALVEWAIRALLAEVRSGNVPFDG
jgi:AcrR family transcriptional regulator